jgi:hypothetical protein
MILAIVLAAQVSAGTPNPCSDQLATLCRISPYFCPGAYPDGLVPGAGNVPCWPQRNPVTLDRMGTGRARAPETIERTSEGARRAQSVTSSATESSSEGAGIIERVHRWVLDRFDAGVDHQR